jgi:hypothetical protein
MMTLEKVGDITTTDSDTKPKTLEKYLCSLPLFNFTSVRILH